MWVKFVPKPIFASKSQGNLGNFATLAIDPLCHEESATKFPAKQLVNGTMQRLQKGTGGRRIAPMHRYLQTKLFFHGDVTKADIARKSQSKSDKNTMVPGTFYKFWGD